MAKILVVDDDRKILETTEDLLISFDHEVTLSDSPEKAFKLLEKNPNQFDLILLDWQLRCLVDGDMVLKIIKFRFPHFSTPIIFITAHSGISSKYLLQIGAFDVLSKPVTADQLMHAIDHAIRKEPQKPIPALPTSLTPDEIKHHETVKQIVDAITSTGSVTDAATKLNMSRSKIYRWLDATGLHQFFIESVNQ